MRKTSSFLSAAFAATLAVQVVGVSPPTTRPTSQPSKADIERRYGTTNLKPFVEAMRQQVARLERSIGEIDGLPPQQPNAGRLREMRDKLQSLLESARADLRQLEADYAAATQPTTRPK